MIDTATFLDLILTGIICSTISTVYILILGAEPVLNWWFMFWLRRLPKALYKPFFACQKCLAGQTAFWLYLIFHKKAVFSLKFALFSGFGYNPLHHVFLICFSVLFSLFITHIINKFN